MKLHKTSEAGAFIMKGDIMKEFFIGSVPAALYGERSERVFIYVHGLFGSHRDAEGFARSAGENGWQVLAVDLPGHGGRTDGAELLPWVAVPELHDVMRYAQENWKHISVYAVSIGAWLSMQAFGGQAEKCLLLSPLVDMEGFIRRSMAQNGISEERLHAEREVAIPNGQPLSWDYFVYACENPAHAICPDTHIFFGENDEITPRVVMERFAVDNKCGLTMLENAAHWIHTEDELRRLRAWERQFI